MNSSTPPVFMVDLPPNSRLIAEGFPSHGVVLSYGGSPFKDFYVNSAYILGDLISESELVFDDDPDWQKYPEIGPFLKQRCEEENCFTVVKCAMYGIWAIGMGSGKKPRQQTSKMAMALALASHSPKAESVKLSYPEYGKLCKAIGSGGGGVASAGGSGSMYGAIGLGGGGAEFAGGSGSMYGAMGVGGGGAGGSGSMYGWGGKGGGGAEFAGGSGSMYGAIGIGGGGAESAGGSGSIYGWGGKGVKGMKGMMGGEGNRWSPYEMYGAGGKGAKGMY